VFRAGRNWRVVENKWPGFRADFHDFDPAAVAAMDETELARVKSDPQGDPERAQARGDSRERPGDAGRVHSRRELISHLAGRIPSTTPTLG
jgi:hypothetical protein